MNKAEKRQIERYKAEEKAASEHMKNLNEQQVNTIVNYVSYQIMYMNDAACNACRFLESDLKKIPYRSRGGKILYRALMKRVNAYDELVKSVTKVDINSLAELNSEIDVYMDGAIDNLRYAITELLKKENVENAEWVAEVEAARTMVAYAVQVSKDYIESLSKINKNAYLLSALVILEIKKVMEEFSTFVQTAAHLNDRYIDLNKDERVMTAYRRFNKAFVKPENFISAANAANETNEKENREKIM